MGQDDDSVEVINNEAYTSFSTILPVNVHIIIHSIYSFYCIQVEDDKSNPLTAPSSCFIVMAGN